MTRHVGGKRLFLAACAIIAASSVANADDLRYVRSTGSNAYECSLAAPCRGFHPRASLEGRTIHALLNEGVSLKAAAGHAATGGIMHSDRLFGFPADFATARAAIGNVQFKSTADKGLFIASIAATGIRGLIVLLQLFAAFRRLD
jgi:hypothetical protein